MNKALLDEQFRELAEDNDLHVDILGEGPTSAEVVIIGEGPGETEIRKGLPFVGGSGRLLFDGLRRFGIHRANTYCTNVVKRQISLSRKGNERHAVDKHELYKWIGLLRWELEQLPNARIVFLLGNYAMAAALDHQGVTNWRGSVLERELPNGKIGKLVITINPAYALREPKMEPMFLMDCDKLARVINNTFKEYKVEADINPSYAQAIRYLRDLRRAKKPVAYDVEVINGETACHGFANDPHHGMCINLRDHVRNRYTIQQEADILLEIQELFTEFKLNSIDMVAQNGMFDSYWVWYRDYLRFKCSFDTLLAHHLMYPQWPHNLGFLCAQYTTHPFYKDEGKKWREGGDIDDYWRYNVKDACVELRVYEREIKELKARNLLDFFRGHVMRLQPHCVAATVHGVAVDMEAKLIAIEKSQGDVNAHKAEVYRIIHELTGKSDYFPNLESWQQLQELFFRKLKLQGRGTSTDKANRERMRKNPKTPALAKELLIAFDRYQSESTFHGTFATSRVDIDNRFRFEFKQYGVQKAPGRLSSKKILNGVGGNIQNQPPRARDMYVADDDCCFIYFDLSQAEARVVAYRANISKWKVQFEKARLDGKYDCHRALAADMFKVPYDQVPEKDQITDEAGVIHNTQRYIAKRCRHGLNYRMEIDKLSEVTGLPYHEARHAFHLYHRETPELKLWWKQEEKTFRADKVLYNAFGRPLKIIQRINDDVLDSIIAFYPQSSIGDKVCQVWYEAAEDDKWPRTARIAMNIHDALVGMVGLIRKKDALTALSILKKYAEKPMMIQDAWHNKPEKLIIPAETKISTLDIRDKSKKIIAQDQYHRWSNMITVQV